MLPADYQPARRLWTHPQYRKDVDRLRAAFATGRWNLRQAARDVGVSESAAYSLMQREALHPQPRVVFGLLEWLRAPRSFSEAERAADAWIGFSPDYVHAVLKRVTQLRPSDQPQYRRLMQARRAAARRDGVSRKKQETRND